MLKIINKQRKIDFWGKKLGGITKAEKCKGRYE